MLLGLKESLMNSNWYLRQLNKMLCGCLFSLIIVNFSNAQTGREIIDKYLDTISSGEAAKWERVKTFYATSKGYFSTENFKQSFGMPNSDKISYLKIFRIGSDKMKEELYGDSLFQQLTSSFFFVKNKKIIFLNNVPPMEVTSDNSLLFDFPPTIVKKYLNESTKINYVGISNVPNSPLKFYQVDLKTKDGQYRSLFFEVATFLLGSIYFPEANVYWTYSNYKNIDGYLIPTVTENVNDGVVFSRRIYETIKFNGPMDKSKFEY
jgi:hypothetical protein